MAETSRQERLDIARRRLLNILRAHTIALGRTLEQKIADAGPYNQRIDPHVLTQAPAPPGTGRAHHPPPTGQYPVVLSEHGRARGRGPAASGTGSDSPRHARPTVHQTDGPDAGDCGV